MYLVNIYAPNKEANKKAFFAKMVRQLELFGIDPSDTIVTAGDWNSIFDNKLDICDKSCDGNTVNTEVKLLISNFDLCDIWRTRNNKKRRYMYRKKTNI